MSAPTPDRGERLLGVLCAASDLVVVEQLAPGRLRMVGEAPDWFLEAVARPGAESPAGLEVLSPYLEHFLDESAGVWAQGGDGRLDGGVFEERHAGAPLFLQAEAIRHGDDALLLVRRLGADFRAHQAVMQSARENLLANERLEAEVLHRTEDIRRREEEIALHLLSAASLRDKETGAHVRRIGLYSEALARALGLSPQRQADLRIAAPMHDVGKIGIPDRILQKPGRLTGDEFEIMKTHAALGGEMLVDSEIPLLQLAASIARHHHERWDGDGYPDGLAGEAIPLAARIVAVVDVYDALVHARVYKEAMPEREVVAQLRAEAGAHFDPSLIDLFVSELDVMRAIRIANPDEDRSP